MTAVGITASRSGLFTLQLARLARALADLRIKHDDFRHGDCVGGDAEGHEIAVRLGYHTIAHPPSNPKLRAWTVNNEVLPVEDYLKRNRAIVDASAVLIGCPTKPEKDAPRSGTWATIRYARRVGRAVGVIMPDGSVTT